MKDVLRGLNLEVGVKGSMVVTTDGVPVHSEITLPLNGDVVGAVASSSILRINEALRAAGSKDFTQFVFSASFGKMAFVATRGAYLVVVLDKSINLDLTMLSITSAARKIQSSLE